MAGFIDASQQQARLDAYNKRFRTIMQIHLDDNSSVLLMRRESTGKYFAVKRVVQHSRLKKEVIIMQSLPEHERIIRLRKIYERLPTQHTTTMHLDFCSLGDLDKWAKARDSGTPPPHEAIVWHLFTQIAEALAFLHTGHGTNQFDRSIGTVPGWAAIMHSDIKPANIFLVPGSYAGLPNIKLGDFGSSEILKDPTAQMTHIAGTPKWLAPESVERSLRVQGLAGDVWALGAIIFWLVRRVPPIEDVVTFVRNKYGEKEAQKSPARLEEKYIWETPRLVQDIESVTSEAGKPYSHYLSMFMLRALEPDPGARITALQLAYSLLTLQQVKISMWVGETKPEDGCEMHHVLQDDIVSDVE